MRPEEFSISTTSLAECELVTVRGELDGNAAGEFARAVEAPLTGDRPLLIDLSELRFIDSRGVHALMQTGGDGHRTSLVCPEGNVSRVLSIVRIDRVMPVYGSVEDALSALR